MPSSHQAQQQQTQSLSSDTAKHRRRVRLAWLIASICVMAVIIIVLVALLVIKQQGVLTGGTTLSVLALVVGMVVSILTLLVNFFQWHSSTVATGEAAQPALQTAPLPYEQPVQINALATSSTMTATLEERPPEAQMVRQTSGLLMPDVKKGTEPPRSDWGEAPTAEHFYGRTHELATLQQWIEQERCRLIVIQGLGGVGKTALTLTLAQQVSPHFDMIFWRTLQNTPPLIDILTHFFQLWPDPMHPTIPQHIDAQIMLLINYLRRYRCLLVLDNFESVLQDGNNAGYYRDEYQGFGRLLELVGSTQHQSCLLLTSREKPRELARLEGKALAVRSLQLQGVAQREARNILSGEDLFGNDETWQRFTHLYSGNPLAMKLASEPLRELFHGDIAAFLAQSELIVGDMQELLDQQFQRSSPLEQEILYWLAIEREQTSLETLRSDIIRVIPAGIFIEALKSLRRRSLVESHNNAFFSLQAVIMEYITARLLHQIQQELHSETPQLFQSHALMKAESRDYLRRTQIKLLLEPLASYMHITFGPEESKRKWERLLDHWRFSTISNTGYGVGNILNLLIQTGGSLQGYNFSHLVIRQAFLQDVRLEDIDFSDTDLATCSFTESFGNILSLALSPDQTWLAAGTANGTIELWQLPAGTPLSSLTGHTDWIRTIAFSPDGRWLASGSDDQGIRLWDVASEQCIKIFQGQQGRIYSVTFSPDGTLLASGGDDQLVYLWDIASGQCLHTFAGHNELIRSVIFSPDSLLLISGSEGTNVIVWDLATREPVHNLQNTQGHIYSLALSSDGQTIASGSDKQIVRFWDVATGKYRNIATEPVSRIREVAFSPDGRQIAGGDENYAIRIWDVESGHNLAILEGHRNRIRAIVYSADGSLIVSGGDDQAIRIWDVKHRQCIMTLQGHSSWVYAVAASPDGRVLAGNGENLTVKFWEIASKRCLNSVDKHKSWIYSMAFSPDGSTFATGCDDHMVGFWNVHDNYSLRKLTNQGGRVRAVAFSPNSKLLASVGDDQEIHLWDVQTARHLYVLTGHHDRIRAVTFLNDTTLASGGNERDIFLWDLTTRHCSERLPGHKGKIQALAFDAQRNLLVSGGDDHDIFLWQLHQEHNNPIKTLSGHSDRIYSLAFSPDGSLLASGSEDHTIRLWDTSDWHCLHTLRGHTQRIRSVIFNPQDATLLSGSHDGTIKQWDAQSGNCLQTWQSDRPYERMNITGARGLNATQKAMLITLGAQENTEENQTKQTLM
ncbi:NACHT domain-containing protein [Dictyobacter arantiisoli]|uniref:Orc1-like AAA ATPase domain-containing protein n=1 Tax=Dictyobacter arantiisoli TaxID=2014874 RepID=A0A5A5TAK5_9CHLR|nr:NACHT domain-containing protein [Dictyobacter arantiisoli]GCF08428.1 hypothetical protein KDI_19920 [Dictyobacter arantiisoli]